MKKTLIIVATVVLLVSVLMSVFVIPVFAKDTAEVVKGVLRSQTLFDDLAKLVDAVKTNDGGKVFMCVLEIYPDLITEIKKNMEPEPTGAVISVGSIRGILAVAVFFLVALAVLITYCIMKKKMNKLINAQKAAAETPGGTVLS